MPLVTRSRALLASISNVAMPPDCVPALGHALVGLGLLKPTENAVRRQASEFLNCHHAGSVAASAAKRITCSNPITSATSDPGTIVVTSLWLPVFVSQAKFLLIAPSSPTHWSHRRPRPAAP